MKMKLWAIAALSFAALAVVSFLRDKSQTSSKISNEAVRAAATTQELTPAVQVPLSKAQSPGFPNLRPRIAAAAPAQKSQAQNERAESELVPPFPAKAAILNADQHEQLKGLQLAKEAFMRGLNLTEDESGQLRQLEKSGMAQMREAAAGRIPAGKLDEFDAENGIRIKQVLGAEKYGQYQQFKRAQAEELKKIFENSGP